MLSDGTSLFQALGQSEALGPGSRSVGARSSAPFSFSTVARRALDRGSTGREHGTGYDETN